MSKATREAHARRREAEATDDEYDLSYDGSARFPNGMPRVIDGHIDMINGIPHVYYDNAYHPNFTDHRLLVDTDHKSCGHYAPVPHTNPLRIEYYNDYERSNQEAFDDAWAIQRQLETEGHFVPIEVH